MRSAESWIPRSVRGVVALAAWVGVGACAAVPEPEDVPEDELSSVDRGEGVSSGTVQGAADSSCATASVKGLSAQIIAEANCKSPDAFAAVPSLPNLQAGSNVFLHLEKPARDALVSALKAHPDKTMTVNSALRTVAQQYLLYRWYQTGSCGISLAAKPGNSNHETGLALDVDQYSSWKSALSGKGFSWLGGSDPVHFDYVGSGAQDHRGLDVLAFQRLWNRNHPEDEIAEDGDWGPSTESRMKKSPAAGFPKGASCACDAVFEDICGSAYRKDIEWLKARGLTNGCDAKGNLYCPDKTVSRGQMASFLSGAMGLPDGPDAFVDDDGSPYEEAINAIAKAGITTGCDAQKKLYCPDQAVSRGQMAAFLHVAFGP